MNILLISLACSSAAAILLWYIIRPSASAQRTRIIFLVSAICGLAIGGFVVFTSAEEINHGIAMDSWPEASGLITKTSISDDRRQRPEITVAFTVAGKEYSVLCDLGISGFGMGRSRVSTSRKIIALYPPGKKVTLHYNPDNPKEATLRGGLRWAPLARISAGATFFSAGLFFLLSLLVPIRKQ